MDVDGALRRPSPPVCRISPSGRGSNGFFHRVGTVGNDEAVGFIAAVLIFFASVSQTLSFMSWEPYSLPARL